MIKQLVAFAHDPGTTNYGYAIVKGVLVGKKLHIKIIENGKLKNTIKQMKKRMIRERERIAYLKEVQQLVKRFKPDFQIAERYMTRGIKGILIECVSSMLNSLEIETHGIPLKLIPAVTWKTELKKWSADMRDWYRRCKTTPHQLDAACMGIFGIMKVLKAPRQKLDMWKLIYQLEATSKVKLHNRKSRQKEK